MNGDNTQENTQQGGGNSGQRPPPAGGSPVDPNPQRQPGPQNPEQPRQESESIFRKIEAYCGVALVLITGAYTVVAYLTLGSIQSQTTASIKSANAAAAAASIAANTLRQTRAQATAESTAFAEQRDLSNKQLSKLADSIKAANRQADASNRQADISAQQAAISAGNLRQTRTSLAATQANFLAEQRPFVFANISGFSADATRYTFTTNINIANYGRSPAEYIKIKRSYSWGQNAWSAADGFFANIEASTNWKAWPESALPPGVGSPPSSFATVIWGPDTRDLFLYFSERGNVMAVFGRIRYADRTGRHSYYTDFCQYRLATGAAAYCDRHNYME